MLEYVRSGDFLFDSPTYLKMDVVANLLFFIQVSEKNNEPIPRKRTDRRKHGQKDRHTLFLGPFQPRTGVQKIPSQK